MSNTDDDTDVDAPADHDLSSVDSSQILTTSVINEKKRKQTGTSNELSKRQCNYDIHRKYLPHENI